jgi:hypothetical protein
MERVLPTIVSIVERVPSKTIFTRFIPPSTADYAHGRWRALLRETDRAVQLTKPTTLSWDYMRGALTYKWSLPRRIHFPESAKIVNLGSDHSPVGLGR